MRCLSPYSTDRDSWRLDSLVYATQATDTINHLTPLSVGHRNGVERSRLPRKISRESRMGLTIQLRALVMSLAFVTSPMSISLCLFPFVYSPRPHKCEHCLWKLDKFQKMFLLCKVNNNVYQFSHVNSLCYPLLLRFWHIFIFISTVSFCWQCFPWP